MPERKMYRDPDAQCPIGHIFSIVRRTSSMGKYVRTYCPICSKFFRGYASVVVGIITNRLPDKDSK